MTKIWLDDNRPAPDGWLWVKTAQEAIDAIIKYKPTHISLDNDLGIISEVGEGYHVAQFIEQGAYYKQIQPMHMTVHTQNYPRGRQMVAALQKAIDYWDGQGTVVKTPFQSGL